MDNLVPPRYTPPFLVMPIELCMDQDGHDFYGMTWEVWDSLNQTVEIYDTEEAAWAGLRTLTIEYGNADD